MDTKKLEKIYIQKPNCVTSDVDNEVVIVPVQNNLAEMDYLFTLNETAAFIWQHLDGKRNLNKLAVLLTENFEVDLETAQKDVLHIIDDINEFVKEVQ